MAWTLGGITISPGDEGDDIDISAFYAIQAVLDAASETLSFYGGGSQRRNLKFVMFENSNGNVGLSTLLAAVGTDAAVALVSDQGAQGNYRIQNFKAARKMDKVNTQPVYMCSASLIKES